jgi:hypothetical protein
LDPTSFFYLAALKGLGCQKEDGENVMIGEKVIDERVGGLTALWIENKRDEIGAGWDSRISDLLNDPSSQSLVSIFGPGFSEELPSAATRNIRPLNNYVGHSGLIRQD